MRAVDILKKAKKCRVRLTRLSDARMFSGILQNINLTEAVVMPEDPIVVQNNQVLHLEIHSPVAKLSVRGEVVAIGENKITLNLISNMSTAEPSEAARIAVNGVKCEIPWDGDIFIGEVLDVSREGMAFRMMDSVAPGTILKVTITNGKTAISVKGVVRYCRELNDGMGNCRLGMQIYHDGRVGVARWTSFLDQAQEAA